MTTLDAALTPTELGYLSGQHTMRRWLFRVTEGTKATAQINQVSFVWTTALIGVDHTSAGWSDVASGDKVLVGTLPGGSDIGIYRARAGSSGSTLALMEISQGDAGLLPGGLRPNTLSDNLYVTIVDNSNFWSILPLIVSNSVFEDYNRSPGDSNTNPSPLPSISISGSLRVTNNHWFGFCDDGQTYATLTFQVVNTLWPTSSSAGHLWIPPSAWGSPTAGSLSGASVTFQVPRSTTTYKLQYVATENSVSQTQDRDIFVGVGDRSGTYAPLSISDMSGDGWNDTGASMQWTLYGDLLSEIPDGAMVAVVDEAYFGGHVIQSAVNQFVGWFVRAGKHGEPGIRQAQVDFVGPAGLLASRRGTSQIFYSTGDSSIWQYAPPTVISLPYAMWWLLKNRMDGVLRLFNLNLPSTHPTGQSLPSIDVAGAAAWTQISNLANGIRAFGIGCDPDGSFWVRPNPVLYPYALRADDITNRLTFDASNIHDYDLEREYIPPTGWVRGESFSWDGSASQPTPLLSIAPGNAPGQGSSEETLQNQVVPDQATINQLCGDYYAMLTPDYSPPSLRAQSNIGAVLKPAQRQMALWNIPAKYNADGVAFSRNIIPTSVQRTFTRVGSGGSFVVDSEIQAIIETTGQPGTTVPVPQQVSQPYSSFSQSSTLPTATTTQNWSSNGATVFHAGGVTIKVSVTTNFLDPHPIWIDITGTGLTGAFQDWKFDPWSPRLISPTKTGPLGAYMFTSTGVFYCTNLLVASPVWTQKQAFTSATNLGGQVGAKIKASINVQGVVYVGFHPTGTLPVIVKAKKLSAYGATVDWATDVGSALDISGSVPFDIDSFGADEMLIAGYLAGTGTDGAVYRISGGTPAIISGTRIACGSAGKQVGIRFIQKPVKTLAGADNRSTGASEVFFFGADRSDNANSFNKFYKTASGGSSITDITPTVSGTPQATLLSGTPGAFVGDPNILAYVSEDGNRPLFTSPDGGQNWTQRGDLGSSAAGDGGYFPRQSNGSYALYLPGVSDLNYSPDFGVTIAAKGVGYSGVAIPLY